MPGPVATLFDPLELGDLTLRNRIAMAPMTRARCRADGVPIDEMAVYYSQRASAGLIIAEGAFVSKEAMGWEGGPGIYLPEHVEGWKKTTKAVHDAKGLIFCQLWHAGRVSDSSFRPDEADGRGVAPSPIAMKGSLHTPRGKVDAEVPRELTTREVESLAGVYAHAARCAKEAGFDGVEMHCANGYLLNTFLETRTNQRTDKYGGSNENRFRVVGEILDAVLTIWPAKRVGVRISPNGIYNDMGTPDFREIFPDYAKRLDKYRIGYLHVMVGLGFGFHELGKAMAVGEFRSWFSGVLMGATSYSKELLEKELSVGDLDMASFGRPSITNPDLVERFKTGAELAKDAPVSQWYGAKDPICVGYTEYPTMSAQRMSAQRI